ncbi:hypothetical protein EJD97_019506, partial [Solanum chilense]
HEDKPRNHKESLCLLWFTHNMLLPKDINNNKHFKWVIFCPDIESFNNYPWVHESFKVTLDYLLKPLGAKTSNLFGFPWAFMACEFEVIPYDATDDSYVATDDSSIATCDTNIAIDDSSVATCDTKFTTNDSFVATCDINVSTDAHMCQPITHL